MATAGSEDCTHVIDSCNSVAQSFAKRIFEEHCTSGATRCNADVIQCIVHTQLVSGRPGGAIRRVWNVRCTWRLASTPSEGLEASTPTPMTSAFLQRCTILVMTSKSMPMTTRTHSSCAMSFSARRSLHVISRRERTFLAAVRSAGSSPALSTAAVLGRDLDAMDGCPAPHHACDSPVGAALCWEGTEGQIGGEDQKLSN